MRIKSYLFYKRTLFSLCNELKQQFAKITYIFIHTYTLLSIPKVFFSYPFDLSPFAADKGRRSFPVGFRRICDWSPTYSNMREIQSNWSNFNHSTRKYGSNRRCHPRQPPACLWSWTQLNFAGKLAVNAWDRWIGDKCSQTVPAAVPGMSAAFENQA